MPPVCWYTEFQPLSTVHYSQQHWCQPAHPSLWKEVTRNHHERTHDHTGFISNILRPISLLRQNYEQWTLTQVQCCSENKTQHENLTYNKWFVLWHKITTSCHEITPKGDFWSDSAQANITLMWRKLRQVEATESPKLMCFISSALYILQHGADALMQSSWSTRSCTYCTMFASSTCACFVDNTAEVCMNNGNGTKKKVCYNGMVAPPATQ